MTTQTATARINPGTLSHGTHLDWDLIPVFAAEYVRLTAGTDRQDDANRLAAAADELLGHLTDEDGDYAWTEEQEYDAQELCGQLMNRLDEVAGEHGFRFGAHEGDGADFGFWQDETNWLEIATVAELPDELLQISTSQDVRATLESIGLAHLATDFGCLFVGVEDGEYSEVWACESSVPYLSATVVRLY